MVARRHDRKWRAPPQGFALASLAVAIQLLLPFLIAFEIAAASTPAYAETTSLCLTAGSTGAGAPASHNGKTGRHGVAGGCPICVTLAASQAFTAPAPVAAPPPPERPVALFSRSLSSLPLVPAPASYRSRAPPFIV
jgi:hypothetical protein